MTTARKRSLWLVPTRPHVLLSHGTSFRFSVALKTSRIFLGSPRSALDVVLHKLKLTGRSADQRAVFCRTTDAVFAAHQLGIGRRHTFTRRQSHFSAEEE